MYSNNKNHEIYYNDDKYLNNNIIEKKLENQNDFKITKIKNIFIKIFSQKLMFVYQRYNILFYFNNKLHKYIR